VEVSQRRYKIPLTIVGSGPFVFRYPPCGSGSFGSIVYRLTSNLIAGIGPSIQEAQTFRVGITGSLTGVDVFLEIQGSLPPPGTFFLDVRPTIADVPVEDDTMLLASTTLPTSVFPLVSFGLGEVG
jgi:hypothetical protein